MKSGGEGRDRKEKDEAGQWGGACQGQGQEEAQGVEYDKKKEEGEEEIEEQQQEGRGGGGTIFGKQCEIRNCCSREKPASWARVPSLTFSFFAPSHIGSDPMLELIYRYVT